MSSGQVTAPPSPATRPMLTCGSDMNALSAMYTTSQLTATLQPRPTAAPLTAAMTGLGNSAIASSSRHAPRSDSRRRSGSS